MTIIEANVVLEKNFHCLDKSFLYDLYERNRFSRKRFWELYDCMIILAQDALDNGRDMETVRKITCIYQRILQQIIWHLDKRDLSELKNFPQKKYSRYIERLDDAIDAYFRGVFVEEELYELKRPKQ